MRWKRRRSPAQARTGDNEDEEKAITSFRVHFFKGGAIFLLSYCLVMSSVSSSAQSTHKCCVVGLMCVCVFVCGKPTELVCETSCVCGTMRMWWRGRCREDTLWLTPLGAALQCASGESPDWQFSVFRLCWTLLTAAIGVSFSPLSVLFWNLSRVFVPFTFCLWHTCTYTSKFSDSWYNCQMVFFVYSSFPWSHPYSVPCVSLLLSWLPLTCILRHAALSFVNNTPGYCSFFVLCFHVCPAFESSLSGDCWHT